MLDNKSELRVLQGRLDDADAELQEAMKVAAEHPGLQNSWQYLAATESRVRLLHLRGASREAGDLALAAEQDADRRSDDLLRLSYRLLRAGILLDSGSVAEAADLIRSLLAQRHRLSRTQDLELERLLGEYFARQGDHTRARDHVLRAVRQQDAYSSAITRIYLERSLRRLDLHDVPVAPGAGSDPAVARIMERYQPPLDAVSLRAAEHLFAVASQPELLGAEVISLLHRSGCIASVELRSAPDTAPPPEAPDDRTVIIPLGTFLGQTSHLVARPASGLAALDTLLTIRRIVGAAVESNERRTRDAMGTSLWQFEPVAGEGLPVVLSSAMQQILVTIRQLATSDIPVLLTGETGTGKEVFARELHRASGARGAFVPFNCTALPKDMLDSQLFGYRRGAFTGATDNFPGIVRSAVNGTLFLDEIGELGLDLQPKLLRLLDQAEIQPLGEAAPVTVRVRLVAATNANLEALIADGRFREDLYYRLNVARVHLPPLRERREEIPALADHFLERYAREARKARLTLGDEAVEALLLYRWPGNVRQLAHEMRRLVAFASAGQVVTPSALSPEIVSYRRAGEPAASQDAAPDRIDIALDQSLASAVEQLERVMVERAMQSVDGHLERAAKVLAISRKGLFLKRKRLGLA